MKQYIYENHDVSGLVITEASTKQLSEGVLSKVKGASFFLDGYSRNGRFYPKSLWENSLKNPETKMAIEKGLMFGCIGHPKDYSLDELLESGKVSHKVTNIYIDKASGEGIAEYDILDTPSGRILNTVLKSGSEMYVSTRAFGGFTTETKTKGGKKYKILDDKNFVIESIDFVIQPGFLETKPKLVESLREDLELLREDKHEIICEDGLCGLELGEAINEKEEIEVLDKSVFENLSKDEVITMLENVISENKILSNDKVHEDDSSSNQDDMMVSAKLMINYVSYVELLTKLVRYNVEFEKYYDQLIEFLDKDSKLSTDDMGKLDEICALILKEKDIEESIVTVCTRITELAAKINDDGEKNDKEDKEDKEPKKKDSGEDNSTEVKAKEESFVDYVMTLMKPEVVVMEKITKVQDESLVRELNGQLLQMKEATKFLTQKLDEEMNKAPKKETITETKIEYKVPSEIHEKILKGMEQNTSLTEQLEGETAKRLGVDKELNELNTQYEELGEELDKVTSDFESLKESIEEKESSDKKIFKEILEDNKRELKVSEEFASELNEELEDLTEQLEKKNETLEKYKGVLVETSAKFYASFYKLEIPTVNKLMERYTNEKDLKEALLKEEKMNQRTPMKTKEITVPTYNENHRPENKRSASKKSFLENLTR